MHKYCTIGRYEKVMARCQSLFMLGMSATPERKDGSELIAISCVGPLRTFKLAAEAKFDVEITRVNFRSAKEYADTVYRDNYGSIEVDYSSTLKKILSNKARAERIIDELEKVDDGRYIYIFSDRREYLASLRDIYISRNADKSENLCFMLGGMKEAEILKVKKSARIIFATYQCASEGESIERMNTIILATPCKAQIEQTMGRILRSDKDGKKRILIDFVDENTLLYKQWKTRREFYLSRGYKIN